ncbi:MAG: MBL fold metallo-hydrolase [Lachnospiraceae bacterium]|nr:MBL fold metallo-hydrolase [Lachnospiraceae bacterium]
MDRSGIKRNNIRNALLVIAAACIIGFIVFLVLTKAASSGTGDVLTVTNLKVGKADSAVLLYKDHAGIIDVGTEEAYPVIDSFLKNSHVEKIDYMILTHYDQDHIGSAVSLIDDYDIEKIYLPDYVSEKRHYQELMDRVKTLENVTFVNTTVSEHLDGLTLDIIPASDPEKLTEDTNDYDNNMSLLCMVSLGSKKLFFTGDIEKDRIAGILDSSLNIRADWIKLPHHGSHEKKMKKFLKKVSPRYSVISTSSEEPPDEELLTLLTDLKIENYDTINDNVVTECDGRSIKVTGSSSTD